MALPISLGLGAVSGLGGLFGSSGPDAQKLAERTARIAALKADAQAGNVKAWWLLGAHGQVAPLPQAYSWGGINWPVNWTSGDWGSAYNGLVDSAARSYRELAPRFQTAAVNTLTTTLGGSLPVGQTISTVTSAVKAIPVWVWLLVGLGVLWFLMKGRG